MANGRRKTRLELTWIGKEERPKLEPRILLEDPEKSYHASVRRPGDIFDNMLIHGDNLLALKAIEADFAGQVKCVFIDPPYNTGAAFEHYNDGLEHSIWLSLMRDRLELLRNMLASDGSLWVSIDDNEGHYLKVICDEVFGRQCFATTIVWRSSDNSNNDARQFSVDHNMILVYSKEPGWRTNRIDPPPAKRKHFKNPDDDPRGAWFDGNPVGSPHYRENLVYTLRSPQGHDVEPPANGWRWSRETLEQKMATGEIRFTPDGKGIRRRTYLNDQPGLPPSSLWADLDETGHNRQAKFEQKKLFPTWKKEQWFGTPKPEKLLRYILSIATKPGDLVLDSFAGSGTTGAVAQKMGRRWIMIELGDHSDTHILPRLRKVVDGEDQGGITDLTEWQGGGGFRYCRLAPSLLQKDEYDNWIINKDYNAAMLAEALCKIEGFKYDPSPEVYWQQGRSTETDYIFVTTQTMTADMLQKLSDEVGPDRSLLVMCKAFRSKREWPNLTVKKIPKAVLAKCEWGQDDYSLEIKELPVVEDEPEAVDDGPQVEPKASGAAKKRRRKAAAVSGGNLFSGDEAEGGGE